MTKPKLPWMKMAMMLPVSLANVAGGLFFIWMPFLFPIGIGLLVVAALPYVYWLSEKIRADIAYADRDHSVNEGEEMPWETEDSELSEDEIISIILNGSGRGSQP